MADLVDQLNELKLAFTRHRLPGPEYRERVRAAIAARIAGPMGQAELVAASLAVRELAEAGLVEPQVADQMAGLAGKRLRETELPALVEVRHQPRVESWAGESFFHIEAPAASLSARAAHLARRALIHGLYLLPVIFALGLLLLAMAEA
jgi:hypothetical protein